MCDPPLNGLDAALDKRSESAEDSKSGSRLVRPNSTIVSKGIVPSLPADVGVKDSHDLAFKSAWGIGRELRSQERSHQRVNCPGILALTLKESSTREFLGSQREPVATERLFRDWVNLPDQREVEERA